MVDDVSLLSSQDLILQVLQSLIKFKLLVSHGIISATKIISVLSLYYTVRISFSFAKVKKL